MKKAAVHNSNNIIERIKRDLSNFRDMFTSKNEVNENEVSELGNDLEKSLAQIDAYAQKYQNSIGVRSTAKNLQANTKNNQGTVLSAQSKVRKKNKEKTENKDSEIEH